jgi:hypothetical protein
MGHVCELAEPKNGLACINISRAPLLGPVRTVQVPAWAAEMGRTRIPSVANPSRRHPLHSSGEQLAHEPAIDWWQRGAAARASTAAVLVGEEEEAGVAAAHPAAMTMRSGIKSSLSPRRSGLPSGGWTGGGSHHRRSPPTPSVRARHWHAPASRRSAFLLH